MEKVITLVEDVKPSVDREVMVRLTVRVLNTFYCALNAVTPLELERNALRHNLNIVRERDYALMPELECIVKKLHDVDF